LEKEALSNGKLKVENGKLLFNLELYRAGAGKFVKEIRKEANGFPYELYI